jgi:transcription elongation factor GreA
MTDQIILTPEGKIKLEEELVHLKEVKRPDISAKIEQAKELGDLSENAEYHDAKDQQGLMESRVVEIEEILKKAIVQEKSDSKDTIEIGTSFVVEDDAGASKEYTLVGFNEADPLNGRISNESPMGQAFAGVSVADTVEVDAPKGKIAFKVLEIK